MEQKIKNFKHSVVYVGNRMSGKLSRILFFKLEDIGTPGIKAYLCKTQAQAEKILSKLNEDSKQTKVHVFMLYCEDTEKTNRKHLVPNLALNLERFIGSLSNSKKFHIYHPYELGMLFGNKLKTNKTFTKMGIACPEIITNPNYDRPIFVNVLNGSRSPEAKVIPNGLFLDPTKYNTKFIDTSYEYRGKIYYVNPRIYALGRQVTHMMIKCSPAEKSDKVVRVPWETTYEEAPGLQYDFFKTQIVPEYQKIKEMCRKVEDAFGFQAYCYDLLRDVKEKKWYVSEIMFKFDSAASVRRAPYSFITYRQIAKEVHGKIYDNDAELEAMETIPSELLNLELLPRDVYHKKLESVHYWVKKFLARHFNDQYNLEKREVLKKAELNN